MKKLCCWVVITFSFLALAVSAQSGKIWSAGVSHKLSSKRFAWAYYEDMTHTLVLSTVQGGVQEYYGVPPKVFNVFMNARLKGSIFTGKIKGKYPSKKVWVKGERRRVNCEE